MLTSSERQQIEEEILFENRRVMKEMLVLGEYVLPKDKFSNYRHSVFNHFGVSGFESKIKTVLDQYTEE